MSIVENHTGLFKEERSTNATPMEEVWEVNSKENARIFSTTNGLHMEKAREVSLKENVRIFEGMEKGGPSSSVKGEEDMQGVQPHY